MIKEKDLNIQSYKPYKYNLKTNNSNLESPTSPSSICQNNSINKSESKSYKNNLSP